MNQSKPIKGWVKASEDNLPKVGNKNIIVRFLGNVYYGKFVNTNGDIELRIPGLKGMYPKDAWKESEYLDETPIQSGEERWISVGDRPLFTKDEKGFWTCTEDGEKEFIAAIPYYDQRKPGIQFWWIRHCVIEDEAGLCVVGDDSNEPAGWEMESITHWQPLPKPPSSEQKVQ